MLHSNLLFLFAACLGLALAQRIDDPRFWAYPEFYDISAADGRTNFECEDRGARCVFQRGDFATSFFGTGQESDNMQGAVWASTTPDAILSLIDCLEEPCKVICNANCTCTIDATNEPCVEGISPAPTPVPAVGAPTRATCPEIKAVEHCPQLMQNNLPLGQAGMFDCYNFCGREFVSACSEGSCGSSECENAGEDGTVDGIVTGCTVEHLNIQLAAPKSNAAYIAVSSTALLAALVVFM